MNRISFPIIGIILCLLLVNCNSDSAISPERKKVLIVQEHLKKHYPDSDYKEINIDSDTLESPYYAFLYDCVGTKAEAITIESNQYRYYYYDMKGDRVQGYPFMIYDTKQVREGHGMSKVIILSKDNEIVYCGSDYPSSAFEKEHIGECINNITNNSKAAFDLDENSAN